MNALQSLLGVSAGRRADYVNPVLLGGGSDFLHVRRSRRGEDPLFRGLSGGAHEALVLGRGEVQEPPGLGVYLEGVVPASVARRIPQMTDFSQPGQNAHSESIWSILTQ